MNNKTINKEHFQDWRKQIDSKSQSDDDFWAYFDTASSVDEAFVQGQWDFAHHILKPAALPFIGAPFDANALEIGFGGGRLLAACSQYFANVAGVDIHDHFDKVETCLIGRGVNNAELIKGDGQSLPVPDNSVDFVYSFIVLQHLPTISVLEQYLRETKRILKPGKPACLYLGHLPFSWRGDKYIDLETRQVETSRENTLLLRPGHTKKLLRDAGLSLVELGYSRKKPWLLDRGAQHYVVATA